MLLLFDRIKKSQKLRWKIMLGRGTLARIHCGRKKHIFFTRFSLFPAPFLSFLGSCIIPVCSVAAWAGTMLVLTQLENCLPCLAVSGPPICWLQRVIGALIDAASRGCVQNVGDTAPHEMGWPRYCGDGSLAHQKSASQYPIDI